MEFWRLVQRPQRHQNLVVKLMRDLDSGYFAVPKYYEVLTSYRAEPLMPSTKMTKPSQKAELPDQKLVKGFLRKYPEAKTEPVALGSFTPSVARRFAGRVTALRQERAGKPVAAAEKPVAAAEKQLAEPLAEVRRRALGDVAGGLSPLEFLQQREQEQLDAGMAALAEGQVVPAQLESRR